LSGVVSWVFTASLQLSSSRFPLSIAWDESGSRQVMHSAAASFIVYTLSSPVEIYQEIY
jgi:hypothetical protein